LNAAAASAILDELQGSDAMLLLKPNCECCDKNLPPEASDAVICTYECTFCAACAADRFGGRCPNCGGNFVPRPIRPPAMLARHPASSERFLMPHPECVAAA
jgi:uncharacterized protein